METVVKITIFGIFILVCALLTPANAESEVKHRHGWYWKWKDYEYERCPHSDYCTNYYDECNSDKGYKVRCNKCSFFQTCMTDTNNIRDPCDDTFICKDIETFKQGKGSFAIMVILTCFLVMLSALSVCLCIGYMKLDKKVKKANNKSVRNAVATYPVKPSYNNMRDDLASPPPPYRENEASAPALASTFLVSSMTFRNNPPPATAATTHATGDDKGTEELRVDITR